MFLFEFGAVSSTFARFNISNQVDICNMLKVKAKHCSNF